MAEKLERAGKPATGWHGILPRAAACLLAGSVLSGCAAGSEPSGILAAEADNYRPVPSGHYLAGLYAGSVSDNHAAADFFFMALEKDPDNPILLRRTFHILVSDGRLSEAVPLADRLHALGRAGGLSQLILALDALKRGKHDLVQDILAQIPGSGFNQLLAPLLRAWSLAAKGLTQEALLAIDVIGERRSSAVLNYFHKALIHDLAGNLEAAEEHYMRTLEADGGELLRVVQAYGRLLERTDRGDIARDLYDRYLKRSPGNPILEAAIERLNENRKPSRLIRGPEEGVAEALYAAASALAQDRARQSAVVYLQMARFARPDFEVAQILLADQFEALGRWRDAIDVYEGITGDGVLRWEARLRIAVGLDRLDRAEEAVGMMKELMAERPRDASPVVMLADLLRSRERYREAIPFYDRAISMTPEDAANQWALHYARGICFEREKKWHRAEADFLHALVLQPDQPMVLNYLGYSWIDKGINIEKGRNMIERAVRLRPGDGYVIDSLGWAFFKLAKYDEAVEQLERAVELRPEDSVINDHLGDAYWKVGRRLEAEFQWRHALLLKPEPEVVAGIKRKLEKGFEPEFVRRAVE